MQEDSNFIISNLFAKAENSLFTCLPCIKDERELYFYNYCTKRKLIRAFSAEKFKAYVFFPFKSCKNILPMTSKGVKKLL